jgi:hypothetical protein
LVHEAAPQLRCLVVEQPYKQDPAVDIWCPLFAFIDRPSIEERLAHGDEVWSYTALAQLMWHLFHPQPLKISSGKFLFPTGYKLRRYLNQYNYAPGE